MPRVYIRKFDYDEARARFASGESIRTLANEYGVSWSRVQQVVVPEAGDRAARRAREHNSNGACVDCGARIWRCGNSVRCRDCAGLLLATSVRPDSLQCRTCREWKPDDDFPHNRAATHARRGRHETCRPCLTIAKRDWRHRNAEKQRAYDREYKRKRRAEAKA